MEFQAGSRIVVLIPVGVEGKGDPVEDNGHVLRNRCDPISVMSRLTWHTTQPTLQYPIVVVLTGSNKKPREKCIQTPNYVNEIMWLSRVKRRRGSCWIVLSVFCGMQFFIKHSIFRKGTFPFTSLISILSVSSFEDSQSLGVGQGKCWSCCNINKKIEYFPYKRFRDKKK